MSRKIYTLFVVIAILALTLSACTGTVVNQTVVIESAPAQAPAAAAPVQNLPPVSGGEADALTPPTAMPTNAPAFTPIKWDNTCKDQSTKAGVALKPLAEGAFFACVYNGVASKVNIPSGTLADVDLGGIYVAKGPVSIDGVPNLTLRPQRNGTDAEACAQVKALTNYGQTLPEGKKFEAQPYNFSCN